MEKLSKANQVLLKYYEKGYRVKNNILYNEKNEKVYIYSTSNGYLCCQKTLKTNVYGKLFLHRLVAYQKYGNKLFEKGIEVRHLDGDSLNNYEDNILIGTHSENMMDIPKKIRLNKALKASNTTRKYSNKIIKEIRNFHNECNSYKKTMMKFNITSKGSLYYILNNIYQTK
jgi:hypothetical protein